MGHIASAVHNSDFRIPSLFIQNKILKVTIMGKRHNRRILPVTLKVRLGNRRDYHMSKEEEVLQEKEEMGQMK